MSTTHTSKTPKEARDLWATPQWLYNWLHEQFNFQIDLACNRENCKASTGFYSEKYDALAQSWRARGERGFCNPPYSNIAPWLKKGYEESLEGFTSAFLVPTPNGETHYSDYVFEKAAEIIFIKGRIAFVASCDFIQEGKNGKPDKIIKKGQEVNGNTRGSCVIVYRPEWNAGTVPRNASRDEIKARFKL